VAGEGCDWMTVSPVWETASKPGYGPALGSAGLAALLPGAPAIYALGGVDGPDWARTVSPSSAPRHAGRAPRPRRRRLLSALKEHP